MATERQVPITAGLVQFLKLLQKKKQKQLAVELGIPQSIISDISNRRRLPSLLQAVKLERLGIPSAAWAKQVKGAA